VAENQVNGQEMKTNSVKEAKKIILDSIKPITKTEIINLDECINRVLKNTVSSKRTQPSFDTSSMDGYAISKKDIKKFPLRLKVKDEIKAGDIPKFSLRPGYAIRVFTGSFLPKGTERVVLQEYCKKENSEIIINKLGIDKYIRKQGEDFFKGESLLTSPCLLDANKVALAGAMNFKKLKVYKKPKIAVLANGNELNEPGERTNLFRQPASTKPAIMMLIKEWGGEPIDLGIAKDTVKSLKSKLKKGLKFDMIVTIGGASVGDYDLVQKSLNELNFKLNFWKINMRPGKPLMFGQSGNIPILGLPGNPVSSIVCSHLFLKQSIYKLQNYYFKENINKIKLSKDLPPNGDREHYIRGYISKNSKDELLATPINNQDSASLSSLSKANILIIRKPKERKAKKNSYVNIINLK
jgi:molybdopterin molybdotransferase